MDAKIKDFLLQTEADCQALGEKLVKALPQGAFVALYGDLGAGKTVFARGVGKALGLESLQSPTFTILQAYDTQPPLYHFDAYRLSGAEELYAIGFEDYLRENAFVLVEWANLVEEALPCRRMELHFQGSGSETRKLRAVARGEKYEEALGQL